MRRACLVALALSLLAAASASAKGGVIFDDYPDVHAVGSEMKFTVMPFGETHARGVRPLVTFRDKKTGAVVRVRASRSDLNGIAYGTVRLPSTGPWDTRISVGGRALPEDAEPFRVGVGLVQTLSGADAGRAAAKPVADPAKPAADPGGSPAWLWVALAAAALASALALVLIRRRPRGAA